MKSMHKHLANKCPVRFPNKKAEEATSSGVVRDFKIVTAAGAEELQVPKDKNHVDDVPGDNNVTRGDKDNDNVTSNNKDNIKEEEGNHPNNNYGLTNHGTVCKSCVKAQGRCRLHPLK
jgi:hypothetical protein